MNRTNLVLLSLTLLPSLVQPAVAAAAAAPVPPLTWPAHDMNRPAPRMVTPGAAFSHLAPPPADAVVIFDGKDLSRFEGPGTGPTPEQLALLVIEQSVTNLTAAATAARQALVAASFTEASDVSARREAVRAAEQALATARADAFAQLQTSGNRLNPAQSQAMTQQAIRGGGRAGRGGGAPGAALAWKVENGYVEATPGTGTLRTKDRFADFQLHLEWASPAVIAGTGQNRGNSGVIVNGMYEIQVLDSINNPTYNDGTAGSIYGQWPPLVNASKQPGEWQSYDIIFEAPRWDADRKLVKKANVTLIHNGLVVHHRQEIQGPTASSTPAYGAPHAPEMFIELQDHNTPVRYRNIWARALGEYDKP